MAKRASRLVVAASEGCYDATRAAALSGVPKSTIYYWASHQIVPPSVSPVREMLWSYADLMALRVVSWLRHPKDDPQGVRPGSPMREVRRALAELDEQGLDLWAPQALDRSPLLVDRSGKIHIRIADQVRDLKGQSPLDPEWLDLLGPFDQAGGNGPDLVAPRKHLRIVPARVAGEPHVAGSRLTTLALAALAARGMSADRIADMYDVEAVVVEEAVDLEEQLAGIRAAA
jgi:uncharacterized protein (DUF433 family)/DNA-binding transcriptional MerR regulator